MKIVLVAITAALLTCTAPVLAQAGATAPAVKNRVVMQVSDADPLKWNLALNNARNLQADIGRDNVEIEIVAYGPGIGMLRRESPVASRIDEAMTAGVAVVACENTMAGQRLGKNEMLPSIGYVSAGVTEIMRRQQQGWAYLRP